MKHARSADDPSLRASKEYRRGSIYRVRMKNFLTYDNVEVMPGPRLNVVIGPNGSGKSSVVCAICLGLGGSPKILGRADSPGQYVRRGCDSGTIEIELYDPAGNMVVERTIAYADVETEKWTSTWRINGKKSSEKDVVKAVAKYNIQVNNLCQFLPQDRVGDFSRMNPCELLVETQKAVMGDELFGKQQQLIDLQKNERNMAQQLEAARASVQTLQRQNERIERDVERMQRREQLIEDLKILEYKALLVQAEESRLAAQELSEEKKRVKLELESKAAELTPLQAQQEEVMQVIKKHSDRAASYKLKVTNSEKKITDIIQEVEKCDDSETDLRERLQKLHQQRADNEHKLATEEAALANLQENLRQAPSLEELERSYNQAKQALARVRETETQNRSALTQKEAEMEPLNRRVRDTQAKLRQLENMEKQKLERFARADPDAYKTYQWIDKNRHRFRGKVWGPVAMEINVSDVHVARCLEQHTAAYCWTSFVAEVDSDRALIADEFGDRGSQSHLRVNISTVHGGVLKPQAPLYSAQEMALLRERYGLTYMEEKFEAPDIIKEYMRNHFRMHHALVSIDGRVDSDKAEKTLRQSSEFDALTKLLIRKDDKNRSSATVYTSKTAYTLTTSKYGSRETSARTMNIKPQARYLHPGLDEQTQARKNEWTAQLNEIENEKREIEQTVSELREKMNEVGQQVRGQQKEADSKRALIRERNGLASQIKANEQKVKKLKEMLKKDSTAQREECSKELTKLYKRHVGLLRTLEKTSAQNLDFQINYTGSRLSEANGKEFLKQMQTQAEALKQQVDQLVELVADVKERFREKLQELKGFHTRVQNEIPEVENYAARLNELPNDARELRAAITETQSEIDAVHMNPQLIADYNDRKARIERETAELEDLVYTHENAEARMKAIQKPWEEKLQAMVSKIHSSFSSYFAEVGSSGDVILEKHHDFDKWKICLNVQFRENTAKRTLDATVQSGGERAVSTILYLMALQDLTPSPFRVVDEINQGMDAKNERAVFKRIVSLSCGRGTQLPQYFLITPKLLPALEYHPDVSVLIVFNGPYVPTSNEWDMDCFLRGKKRQKSGGA